MQLTTTLRAFIAQRATCFYSLVCDYILSPSVRLVLPTVSMAWHGMAWHTDGSFMPCDL